MRRSSIAIAIAGALAAGGYGVLANLATSTVAMPDYVVGWLWVSLAALVVVIAVAEVRRVQAEPTDPTLPAALTEVRGGSTPAALAAAASAWRRPVELRISEKTLWIGMDMYPLQHVTHIGVAEIAPSFWRLLAGYLLRSAGWLAVGAAGLLIQTSFGDALPSLIPPIFAVMVLGGLGTCALTLFGQLQVPRLHALCVETAGVARVVAVAEDRELIDDLVYRLADAVANRSVEYALWINHIEVEVGRHRSTNRTRARRSSLVDRTSPDPPNLNGRGRYGVTRRGLARYGTGPTPTPQPAPPYLLPPARHPLDQTDYAGNAPPHTGSVHIGTE